MINLLFNLLLFPVPYLLVTTIYQIAQVSQNDMSNTTVKSNWYFPGLRHLQIPAGHKETLPRTESAFANDWDEKKLEFARCSTNMDKKRQKAFLHWQNTRVSLLPQPRCQASIQWRLSFYHQMWICSNVSTRTCHRITYHIFFKCCTLSHFVTHSHKYGIVSNCCQARGALSIQRCSLSELHGSVEMTFALLLFLPRRKSKKLSWCLGLILGVWNLKGWSIAFMKFKACNSKINPLNYRYTEAKNMQSLTWLSHHACDASSGPGLKMVTKLAPWNRLSPLPSKQASPAWNGWNGWNGTTVQRVNEMQEDWPDLNRNNGFWRASTRLCPKDICPGLVLCSLLY